MDDTDPPAPRAAEPAYAPDALYRVTLSCPAVLPDGTRLMPGKDKRNYVKGKYIAGLGSAVADAQPV